MTKARSVAGAFLAAFALAGPAGAQETTLNFLSAQQDNVVQPMIDAFEAANPDIKVVHQSVPFNDLNAATESRIGQGDTSIDLIHADTPRVPAFASKEYLLNLDDRRAEIEAAVPNPVDIEQVSWNGGLYAYPMWTSTQLLFYNKDLLEQAGVEPPTTDPANRETWSQILEKAAAAQTGGAEWGLTFQQVDRYYQLQMLFESAGAGPGLTGDGLLTPAVNTDAWVEVADWYRQTFEDGLSPRGVTPEQTDDLFINGQAAFIVGGPWAIGRYDKNPDLNYGVAPVPYFEGGKPVTPTGSWAISINPHSEKIDAARKFAEFVSLDPEGAYLSVSANPLPPVNAEAYKKYAEGMASMTDRIGPVIDIITYETQNTAVGRPRTVGFVAFETVMNKAFSDIRNGAEAKGALDDAQNQLERQLSRIR